jgi:predicted naringenin-chalcone synthase
MNKVAVLGLATGNPGARYSQHETFEHFALLQGERNKRTRATRAIFERAGVAYRHFVVDRDFYTTEQTTLARNDLYMQEAVPLGETTIRSALAAANLQPQDVDNLVIVSCTGFNIPGLDLLLAGKLGMRPNLHRICVLGMGCYGAFPGLRHARDALIARKDGRAIVLALEICSIHTQLDPSAESIVSAALFGDGAAAIVLGYEPQSGNQHIMPCLLHTATYSEYNTLQEMSFALTDHGFRMYLSSYVPDLLAARIEPFVDNLLVEIGLTREAVRFWGIHPGSKKIVDYIRARLALSPEQVTSSYDVLHDYGNMSSATILFVLEHIQRCQHPDAGDYGVLLAFGPGLTMEAFVLQW